MQSRNKHETLCICTTSVTTGHATFSGGEAAAVRAFDLREKTQQPQKNVTSSYTRSSHGLFSFAPKVTTTRTSFLFSLFHLTAV
jgi:hypothetical protein